ncbi:MAG: hypothetical protein JW891_12160 [Candidatus Lokiarchaeota archaeon]|nr:hypothetical protein [Candidatus Lokiarchaeota archaeon]
MIVFDVIIINSEFIIYIGGVFVFLGIVSAMATNNKRQPLKTQNASSQQQIQAQDQSFIQPLSRSVQQVIYPKTEEKINPIVHQNKLYDFCPYCGNRTLLDTCPECGQEID